MCGGGKGEDFFLIYRKPLTVATFGFVVKPLCTISKL